MTLVQLFFYTQEDEDHTSFSKICRVESPPQSSCMYDHMITFFSVLCWSGGSTCIGWIQRVHESIPTYRQTSEKMWCEKFLKTRALLKSSKQESKAFCFQKYWKCYGRGIYNLSSTLWMSINNDISPSSFKFASHSASVVDCSTVLIRCFYRNYVTFYTEYFGLLNLSDFIELCCKHKSVLWTVFLENILHDYSSELPNI